MSIVIASFVRVIVELIKRYPMHLGKWKRAWELWSWGDLLELGVSLPSQKHGDGDAVCPRRLQLQRGNK